MEYNNSIENDAPIEKTKDETDTKSSEKPSVAGVRVHQFINEVAACVITQRILNDNSKHHIFNIESLLKRKEKLSTDQENNEFERIFSRVLALKDDGIELKGFAAFLSREQDRQLKKKFAYLFLAATFIFTVLSYAIVIMDSSNSKFRIQHI